MGTFIFMGLDQKEISRMYTLEMLLAALSAVLTGIGAGVVFFKLFAMLFTAEWYGSGYFHAVFLRIRSAMCRSLSHFISATCHKRVFFYHKDKHQGYAGGNPSA